MPPPKSTTRTGEQLDEILEILHKMNKRDRLRTIGGFFRGLFQMIPIILILVSVWYFYQFGDQLIEKVAGVAAKQAALMTEKSASGLLDQLDQFELFKPQ